MTTRQPTRSLRSSRRGRHVPFDIGDVVEVDYQNGIVHGRLVAKVTDDPSPATRWLVRYNEAGMKPEEVVCEKSFGTVIEKASPSTVAALKAEADTRSHAALAPKRSPSPPGLLEDSSSKQAQPSSSSSSSPASPAAHILHKDNAPTPRESATSSTSTSSTSSAGGTTSPNGSDVDMQSTSKKSLNIKLKVTATSKATTPALSAREKRRLKREEAQRKKEQQQILRTIKKNSAATSSSSSTRKRRRNGQLAPHSSSTLRNNYKKRSDAKDEEVIKVKLNTGTLYLYRGLNRRAVFVRRY